MTAEAKSATTPAQKKAQRVPLTGGKRILSVRGKEPGFYYSWIGEDMVHDALEAGFDHVRHPVQVGSKRVDVSALAMDSHVTVSLGRGKRAFLMRQPQEFRDEDTALEQKKADEQMAARLGQINQNGLSGNIEAYVTLGQTSKK